MQFQAHVPRSLAIGPLNVKELFAQLDPLHAFHADSIIMLDGGHQLRSIDSPSVSRWDRL
jgi:hypothetical protein